MMKNILWIMLILWGYKAPGQSARLLPRNINHVTQNQVYPAVSGDGKVMLFMTDYSDNGGFVMVATKYRAGKWQDPEDLPVLGSSKVNNWGGYALNYDGTSIYFSSRRSDGIGKFDIWYSVLDDGVWTRPKNIGKPINTTGSEGNPSISPDGQRLYFMRCTSMSTDNLGGCKLYYSQKGPRGWQEAVELPEHLNRGNTTSPRILPDNKTLVFASDRPGGKGGIDLWMTRRTGYHWSEPINIEVVNTPEDDRFLSATMRSIAYITVTTEKDKMALAEIRLPAEFRLENMIIKQGTIKDETGNSLAADVRAYNLDEQAYESRMLTSTASGGYIMILAAGSKYDVSYKEIRQNKLYYSELVDASELVAPRREYPNIVLLDIQKDLSFPLHVFGFKPFTSEFEDASERELSRLEKLLKRYPALKVEIGSYQKVYIEDSIPSAEDLTELRIDTTLAYVPAIRVDTMVSAQKDQLLVKINQALSSTVQDTTIANTYLLQMATQDSVQVQRLVSTYHNDRTPSQAEAVKNSLVEAGIEERRLNAVGYKDATPVVDYPDNRDRMIVIRLLNAPEN
jgi:Tol biopolymer transport system component